MPLPIISRKARIEGCSDSDAREILDFLISVDDETWRTSSEIYTDLRNLLLDEFSFVPVINGRQDFSRESIERLPNAIFKKLVIFTIINMETYSREDISKIRSVFIHMEEEAIRGNMYISIRGRSLEVIKTILNRYDFPFTEVVYSDYLAKNKLDRGISIYNTMIIGIGNNILNI